MSTTASDFGVTGEVHNLIRRWEGSRRRLDQAKAQVNAAECESANAKNALGKLLLPKDAKPGEVFNLWYGDSLLSASVDEHSNYSVSVRQMGKSIREMVL